LFLRCHTALRNTRNLDLAFKSLDAQPRLASLISRARRPGCRHHARVSPSVTVSADEAPKAHKPCPEDRQGTTLVLVARHEILMFPFERIRDVDRSARQ
jgi:hypothetical protein